MPKESLYVPTLTAEELKAKQEETFDVLFEEGVMHVSKIGGHLPIIHTYPQGGGDVTLPNSFLKRLHIEKRGFVKVPTAKVTKTLCMSEEEFDYVRKKGKIGWPMIIISVREVSE